MIELQVLNNDPVELNTVESQSIALESATPPVNSVISVNGKQGVVVLTAEDIGVTGVPTNVRQAMLTLFENAAYATTGLTDEIAVIESWAEEVTSLSVSPTTLSLNGSTPQSITATVVPSGSTVTWSSSDTSIATVVGGVVTGVSNGSCTITASAGDLSATCEVTVAGFATLSSISAVYTQSGTVYDTDSLDSLKADLVVTATYSDSSTATVPSTDYTLSGTLAVGTSVITVAYGGKTDTFSVTVTEYSYSWTYNPATDGVLSVQSYITGATIGANCTESIVDGNLHLYVPKNSSTYITYPFTKTTSASATLKFRIKFNATSQVNAWGYNFMPTISNGTGASALAQRNMSNTNLTWVAFVDSTYQDTNVAYALNTWYDVELIFTGTKQSAKVDGAYIYQDLDLSTLSAQRVNQIIARTNTNTQYTFNADIASIEFTEG